MDLQLENTAHCKCNESSQGGGGGELPCESTGMLIALLWGIN